MANRKPYVMHAEGFAVELPTTDSLDVGAIVINASGTGIDMNGKKITQLGDGTAAGDAVNKGQLDSAVVSGGTVKEALFCEDQLDNTDGINALESIWFAAQPVVGDTVVFTDGTLTRTYTFVADQGSESLDTDVSIETDAASAMERLVLRVNADSANTVWDLYFDDVEHGALNGGNGVIEVIEKASAAGASPSRIYGTWTTQASFQVLEFATGTTPTILPYYSSANATAATSDPGYGRFGLRRRVVDLIAGEIHLTLDTDNQWSWDADVPQWNILSGPGSIPDATSASGGGVKGKVTFDSDLGLAVTSGVAEVKLETDKGLKFETGGGIGIKIASANELSLDSNGLNVEGVPSQFKIGATAVSTGVSATNLDTLVAGSSSDAQSLHTHGNLSPTGHTHTHASTTGQTANDHHNQSHVLDGGDHTVSGLTPGYLLTALTASTFGFAAVPAAPEAAKVENTYNTATDTVANGDPVYFNGTSTLGKARADTDSKSRVTGIIRSGGGAPPTAVEIVTMGPCAGILSGATANTPYYLQATGGIGTSLPAGGNRIIQVGVAINATDLFVHIIDYAKKA